MAQALLRHSNLYDDFSPGEIVFPESEDNVGPAVLPGPTPDGTVRDEVPTSSAESFPSAVPAAVSRPRSAMGPYSPISPATSPAATASTAEAGDGLAVAVEADIPSSLVTAGLISPGGWDPERLLVAFASAAAVDPETTVNHDDITIENNDINVENNDLNNINLDLRNIDFDCDTTFPEIEGLSI